MGQKSPTKNARTLRNSDGGVGGTAADDERDPTVTQQLLYDTNVGIARVHKALIATAQDHTATGGAVGDTAVSSACWVWHTVDGLISLFDIGDGKSRTGGFFYLMSGMERRVGSGIARSMEHIISHTKKFGLLFAQYSLGIILPSVFCVGYILSHCTSNTMRTHYSTPSVREKTNPTLRSSSSLRCFRRVPSVRMRVCLGVCMVYT